MAIGSVRAIRNRIQLTERRAGYVTLFRIWLEPRYILVKLLSK